MRTHWLFVLAISVVAISSSCTGGGQTTLPSSSDLHPASHVVRVDGFGARGQHALSTLSSIYSFKGGSDGALPLGLTVANGTLYGPTLQGGGSGCRGSGCGTVFAINPSGQESILYAFQGGTTGANPSGSLLVANHALYGMTESGGAGCGTSDPGCGTVFSIDLKSGHETVLYTFKGGRDGSFPRGSLIDISGMLYGTTYGGGRYNKGTVFFLNLSSGTETILHSFRGRNDGANPTSGLIAVNGILYGTTSQNGSGCNCGTAFALNLASGKETVLHRFQGGPDGANPSGALLALNGTLYGPTAFGGDGSCDSNSTCGTIFAINVATGQESIVYSFLGSGNGAEPGGSLIEVQGRLYGVTNIGGTRCNCGTVFTLNPSSGKHRALHRLKKTEGEIPAAGLTALNGTFYGTTDFGGSHGQGTVFALTP